MYQNGRGSSSRVAIIFSLVVCLIMSSFATGGIVAFAAEHDDIFTLKILHTNDIHSQIDPLGKIAAYIFQQRASAEHSLYLDAGDIFSGNPVVDLNEGEPIVNILNRMGLDAMAIGNHEFDYGQEAFARNEAFATFQWLSANMTVQDSASPILQPDPYTIFEFDDVKVGVLALTQAPPATAPAGIVGLHFEEDYAAAVNQYAYLRDEVDILIGLTHIGYPDDRQLAEQVEMFDLIIGGHSHTVLSQPVVVNGTPIAQAGSNGNYVGNITIQLNKQTNDVMVNGFLQNVNNLTETDSEIQSIIDDYNEQMEEILGRVIGYSNTGLTRNDRERRDAALGNFWTDAMRDYLNADIALTNNGGIRDSIAPGEITVGDIYRVEPFANEIMEIRMTGQAIRDVIEYSYNRRNQIDLQTSGLHYKVITDTLGNLVDLELTLNGTALDMDAVYTVSVADFIGTGGSGYHFEGEVIQPSAGFMTNTMIAYAEKLMEEEGAIDYPPTEGRIQVEIDPNAVAPGTVIGYTTTGFSDANKNVQDATLGNLYTDAIRTLGQADIAILNGSSVTGQIPAGDITREQIEALDQFGNEIVVVETTGARLKEVILSQSNYYNGVDLQASGITYVLIENEGSGPRFEDVEITLANGVPLAENAIYTVAYNDYMHGRAFYNLGGHVLGEYGKVWEAVVSYIEGQEGPINYTAGTRISIEGAEQPELEVITIAEARAKAQGAPVLIEGVATSNAGPWGAKGFYLQDETAGIYVFQNTLDVVAGQIVRVEGMRDAFNDEIQVSNINQIEVVGTAAIPAPISLSPADVSAGNEGQLVQLKDVTIENLTRINSFGTFEFDAVQGAERVLVRVDNRTGLTYDNFSFANGDVITVTGLSSQFRGMVQVKPRSTEDIFEEQAAWVEWEELFTAANNAAFRNNGLKNSILVQLRNAERDYQRALTYRETGDQKKADKHLAESMKKLSDIFKRIEQQPSMFIHAEEREIFLSLILAWQAQHNLE